MTKLTNAQNEKLTEPAHDIRYLLARGYPRSAAIRFVCDHYRLSGGERHILARVIVSPDVAASRNKKRRACIGIEGRDVLIDGYNVLISIESMLKGEKLWLGDDGFVRDTRGVFRNYNNTDNTCIAVDQILSFLSECKIRSVNVLFDTQMNKSGQLTRHVHNRLPQYSLNGSAHTSRHVDFDLKNAGAGVVVATADGIVIDAVSEVVDIAACLMERKGVKVNRIV